MFELHVVVAAVVMLNILKLIIEIVPNYPTSPLNIKLLESESINENDSSAEKMIS
jgi:hypothetical protein